MRELIITEFVSLDGVMQAPGGEAGYPHAGWVGQYFTDDLGAYKQAEQLAAEILVLGRKTYESFVGAWPYQEGAMADKINTMTKLVASSTLESSDWEGTTLIAENLEDAIRERKREKGGAIIVAGSRSVVHALLDARLVDQINLQVFPVILGSGMRVYPDRPEPIHVELESSRALESGVVLQSYRVTG